MREREFSLARVAEQIALLTEFAAKLGVTAEALLSVPEDDVAAELDMNGFDGSDMPDGSLELLTLSYGSFSVSSDGRELRWSIGYSSRVYRDGAWSSLGDEDDEEDEDSDGSSESR